MKENAGGAVGGKRVVISWPQAQLVHRLYIVEKDTTDVPERRSRSVDVHVFLRLAVVRSYANDVALVGNDVVDLILAKKTGERRIALALLLASFDGYGDVILAAKAKAHHDMGDCLTRPVHRNDVARIELAEIVSA